MDLDTLRTEIFTDPQSLGYAAPWQAGDDATVAALLNAPRGIPIGRGVVPSYEVVGAVVKDEYLALSANDRTWLNFLVLAPFVDLGNTTVRTTLGGLFAAGTASRTALAALATRPGSRAEELFGAAVPVICVSDVRRLS
jgi:hypothetical protein